MPIAKGLSPDGFHIKFCDLLSASPKRIQVNNKVVGRKPQHTISAPNPLSYGAVAGALHLEASYPGADSFAACEQMAFLIC